MKWKTEKGEGGEGRREGRGEKVEVEKSYS
jgi:hypothetical protein